MAEQLIPRVKTDVFNAIVAELTEGKLPYVEELLKRIAVENPEVANFISNLSKDSPDYIRISTCGILVYRLIASQLEANAMNKKLGT